MKIALVYNLNREKYAYEVEFDSLYTIKALAKVLSKFHTLKLIEGTLNFPKWTDELIKYRPDVIFNIAEGFLGPAREAFYPALYEQLKMKYSGPNATNLILCHNKYLTKKLLKIASLPVPNGELVCQPDDLISIISKIKFPSIVKLNSEGSSIGLSSNSIVKTHQELREQVNKLWKKYHRDLLIEQYISGIDISMAFVEGIGIIGPVQVVYPDSNVVYDFSLKTTYDKMVTIQKPKSLTVNTINKLKLISEQIVKTFDIIGYAKIDYRIDNNNMYVLEVNGQVSFHPKGEFVTCAKVSGYSFERLILHIAEYPLKMNYNQTMIEDKL